MGSVVMGRSLSREAKRNKVATQLAEAAPKLARQRRAAKPVVAKLNLGSEYAFLDINEGREELRRHLAAGRVVPIIIRGVIDAEGSSDDGVSQEFDVHVEALEVGEPRKRGKGSYE